VISARSRPSRQRRLPVLARWLLRIAIVIVAFALGVAVGQALEDRPPAGEPVTNISTIEPWTQTTQP
jgi:hypothetical protein